MTTLDHNTQSASASQVTSFVQINSPILYSGLDSDALHLYLILLDKSWKRGCCWPSDRTIGDWMGGRSRDTVNRIFKKLEVAGLIVRTVVPVTPENPGGRLITVNRADRPSRKSATRGAAKRGRDHVANLRHELDKSKKEDGPPVPASGAAPEQTIEERIAEARAAVQMASTGPFAKSPSLRARLLAELAALEAERDRPAAASA